MIEMISVHPTLPASRTSLLASLSVVFLASVFGQTQQDSPAANEEPPARIETIAGDGRSGPLLSEGIARSFPIAQPFGVEIGPGGALWVCEVENHRVVRIDRETGIARVVVGRGTRGGGGDGGPAHAAELDEPYEVRFDASGNLYVVEMRGARVRRVEAGTLKISTLAGTGVPGFGGDGGPAERAQLRQPHSIALDHHGFLYIADIGNHRIRRVDLESREIVTIAGNGERELPQAGETAVDRPMLGPRALFADGHTLWIALREGHSVWTMDLTSFRLDHVAGTGSAGDGDGAGDEASFNGPKGIAVGPEGRVFVVDTENQVIRAIEPRTRAVTTIAGSGERGMGGDGGPALDAAMDRPHGICVDAEGRIYIGDTNNHRVRVVTSGQTAERDR